MCLCNNPDTFLPILQLSSKVVSRVRSTSETIVEHTAAELLDAATQDRCTTYVTMRVGIDRRAKRSQRCLSIAKARATVTVSQVPRLHL